MKSWTNYFLIVLALFVAGPESSLGDVAREMGPVKFCRKDSPNSCWVYKYRPAVKSKKRKVCVYNPSMMENECFDIYDWSMPESQFPILNKEGCFEESSRDPDHRSSGVYWCRKK